MADHNAELCERIRVLEERVAELERDLALHRDGGPHYPGPIWIDPHVYPWYPNQPSWVWPNISDGTTITINAAGA